LNFDLEEFDMPLEYGKSISFQEQISISTAGTEIILGLLQEHQIKSTFFCTATFALSNESLIRKIVEGGHEIASHSYYHSKFEVADLLNSRLVLERISGKPVNGYRMPRMMPVDEKEIFNAGYLYNSSLNPTWIPGRYNNLNNPRLIFYKEDVVQLPASVTRLMRIPLFWLTFHNLPLQYYLRLCITTYRQDGYLNLYYHPWEFTDITDRKKFGFPKYISKNSGKLMVERIDAMVSYLRKRGFAFSTVSSFLNLAY
jgi:peptidoglycan/xylan/chitin deacetylase (PgdA/CDA1 family)